MSHLLLLGAGFSRNWGGWLANEAFEYLLGCPEIIGNAQARQMLWKHQGQGGFEAALAEVQREYVLHAHELLPALQALQGAVKSMFRDMNRGFNGLDMLNFSDNGEASVSRFLTRFDAIFTLNQDLLLELKYMQPENAFLLLQSQRRWAGCELPGMTRAIPTDSRISGSWAESMWYQLPQDQFKLDPQFQPVYKLHGSSNWMHSHGQDLMIIGGAKLAEIDRTPILSWYLTRFEEEISKPGAKLMVIGYGFRDQHVNDAITRAVAKGLKVFVIAPEGADLARQNNPTRRPGQIMAPTADEAMFEQALIGASRRSLREIFGTDRAEFDKVMRFFAG
ncbi:SIR2 family protein [Pelomonas sp. KK5]|uniref:SIR2 family protein n=1 Tax=Pelomonas sp. KK5 TaxID=1855730 RepID=UPI00097C54A3|nr:SIR2 family protein [Pelomonas sp. KK5]